MTDLAALKAANAKRWGNAKVTRSFSTVAKHLVDVGARGRYQAVEKRTGVPWYVIAVIHERESSQDWTGSLAQGDPWNRISVHVPAGRGPFPSWEEAAVDALVNCRPYAARNRDWSIGGLLTLLESYNGLGYANMGIPSPYIWSGTDQYKSGKYVRDGVFNPDVIDAQLGCAGLLIAMAALDRTISFDGKMPPIVISPAEPKKAVKKASGAIIAGGAAAGAAAHQANFSVGTIFIVVAIVVAGVLIWKFTNRQMWNNARDWLKAKLAAIGVKL